MKGTVAAVRSRSAYGVITRHWPRLAAGLVVAIAAAEFALGTLVPGASLEFYVFAWATVTGGLWWVFDRAERAASEESRRRLAEWLTGRDHAAAIARVPEHFLGLFDRVFGGRHLSWRCFSRSAAASLLAVAVLLVLYLASTPEPVGLLGGEGAKDLLQLMAWAAVLNVVPDYLSLLETRAMLRLVPRRLGIRAALLLDLAATAVLSFVLVVLGLNYAVPIGGGNVGFATFGGGFALDLDTLSSLLALSGDIPAAEATIMWTSPAGSVDLPFGIFFYSAFFTSAWLWLYTGAWAASRVLLRLGGGIGFLLGVTDIERQPFRSLGFVSVLGVSGVFLAALPFVLL